MRKWGFERDKTALLVIDMQNDFVLEGSIMEVPPARDLLPKHQQLIAACRRLGVPVVYTIHETHPQHNPMEIAEFPKLKAAGMRLGTKGIEVVDALAPTPGEPVIRKLRYSAFYQTELELVLRNLKTPAVDTLIVCGIMSNVCCESTARDAVYRDYKVIFGSDICASAYPGAHEATLANMEIFGRVMNCEDILAALEQN